MNALQRNDMAADAVLANDRERWQAGTKGLALVSEAKLTEEPAQPLLPHYPDETFLDWMQRPVRHCIGVASATLRHGEFHPPRPPDWALKLGGESGPAPLLVIRRVICRFSMLVLVCHAETIRAQQEGNATKRIRRARKKPAT